MQLQKLLSSQFLFLNGQDGFLDVCLNLIEINFLNISRFKHLTGQGRFFSYEKIVRLHKMFLLIFLLMVSLHVRLCEVIHIVDGLIPLLRKQGDSLGHAIK